MCACALEYACMCVSSNLHRGASDVLQLSLSFQQMHQLTHDEKPLQAHPTMCVCVCVDPGLSR